MLCMHAATPPAHVEKKSTQSHVGGVFSALFLYDLVYRTDPFKSISSIAWRYWRTTPRLTDTLPISLNRPLHRLGVKVPDALETIRRFRLLCRILDF